MKFYLAGAYRRRAELRGYAEQLQALGHEITSRWLFEEPPEGVTDDGVTLTGPEEALYGRARMDVQDVERCDILIGFSELRGVGGRGGRHVEWGVAATRSKGLLLIGPFENLFHYLSDQQYDTWGEFISTLR